MSDYQTRFAGIARLYGEKALTHFQQAHVVVIGIGGVGSWAAEALARSGIGELTLIDLDDICVSNINRQLHALSSTVGQDKVAVMAERIRQINPDCVVHQVADFIAADNLAELLGGKPVDYVLDAIDSVKAKTALIAWCKRRKIPLITTGGAGGQLGARAAATAAPPTKQKAPLPEQRGLSFLRATCRWLTDPRPDRRARP